MAFIRCPLEFEQGHDPLVAGASVYRGRQGSLEVVGHSQHLDQGLEPAAPVTAKFSLRGSCFCLHNRGGWWGWGAILPVGGESPLGGETGNTSVTSKMPSSQQVVGGQERRRGHVLLGGVLNDQHCKFTKSLERSLHKPFELPQACSAQPRTLLPTLPSGVGKGRRKGIE